MYGAERNSLNSVVDAELEQVIPLHQNQYVVMTFTWYMMAYKITIWKHLVGICIKYITNNLEKQILKIFSPDQVCENLTNP